MRCNLKSAPYLHLFRSNYLRAKASSSGVPLLFLVRPAARSPVVGHVVGGRAGSTKWCPILCGPPASQDMARIGPPASRDMAWPEAQFGAIFLTGPPASQDMAWPEAHVWCPIFDWPSRVTRHGAPGAGKPHVWCPIFGWPSRVMGHGGCWPSRVTGYGGCWPSRVTGHGRSWAR